MDNISKEPDQTNSGWTATQTYAMAAVCLLIGVLMGYLVRGSANPAGQNAPSPAQMQQAETAPSPGMPPQMPSIADMKQMADRQAEPLLAKLKSKPNDVDTLNKVGMMYKAGHQFKEAVTYFGRALSIDPQNVPIRTDMASCMYYTGDVDGAITELQESLTYDPKHAGTLMNLGIIEWKGKNDAKSAIAAWQTLLKLNPDFPEKSAIERLIEQAQESEGRSPAPLQAKQ